MWNTNVRPDALREGETCLVDCIECTVGYYEQAEASVAPNRDYEIAIEFLDDGWIVGKEIGEPITG